MWVHNYWDRSLETHMGKYRCRRCSFVVTWFGGTLLSDSALGSVFTAGCFSDSLQFCVHLLQFLMKKNQNKSSTVLGGSTSLLISCSNHANQWSHWLAHFSFCHYLKPLNELYGFIDLYGYVPLTRTFYIHCVKRLPLQAQSWTQIKRERSDLTLAIRRSEGIVKGTLFFPAPRLHSSSKRFSCFIKGAELFNELSAERQQYAPDFVATTVL